MWSLTLYVNRAYPSLFGSTWLVVLSKAIVHLQSTVVLELMSDEAYDSVASHVG